jgi:hypothetical protein
MRLSVPTARTRIRAFLFLIKPRLSNLLAIQLIKMKSKVEKHL